MLITLSVVLKVHLQPHSVSVVISVVLEAEECQLEIRSGWV